MDGLRQAVMIITLLWFFALSLRVRYSYMSNLKIFTCHCYFAIFSRTCQFQCCLTPNIFFSAIPFENMQSWLSMFVFYALFSGASSYFFMDIAFYTSAAVVVSSGWHSASRQAGCKPPKSTHDLKHLIWYIHVLIRWTSNLIWYSNGTCCYVLASEIHVQLPLKLSFCLRLCRDYKSAFI